MMMYRYHVCLLDGREYWVHAVNVNDAIAFAISQAKAEDAAKGIEPVKRPGRKPKPYRFVKNLGEL